MNRRSVLGGLAVAPALARNVAAREPGSGFATIVERWATANGFAGVISLGKAGRVTQTRALGLALIEADVAATPATKYAFGSVSKWFTTTAVLRLSEMGLVNLDAAVATYLPTITGDAGAKARLVHLLSNTSGIPDRLGAALKTDPSLGTSVEPAAPIAARYASGELIFEPGTQFDYHVLNWVVVRAIVERVTGRDFVDVVRELVLRPARVETVGIAEHGFAAVPGLAPAYRSTNPPVQRADPVPPFAAASGSFYGTTSDLVAAAHAIFGPRLLSAASRKAMLTVRWPEQAYAIGGRVRVVNGRTWAWETGQIGGYRTHLAHDVEADRTIALAGNTNMDQATITQLVDQLIAVV